MYRGIVGSDDRIDVLLCVGLPGRRGGGPCTERRPTRPLHAGISVCLVVIADVEEIGPPLECPRHCLDTDIERPAVPGIDDHVRLLPGGPERIAHARGTGGSGPERDIIDRDSEGSVRVDALDDAGTTGRHDQHGIVPCSLQHVPQGQRVAAPGTGGRAFQDIFFLGNFGDSNQTP